MFHPSSLTKSVLLAVEFNHYIEILQVKQSPSSKTSDSAATPKVGENLDASCSLSSKKTPGRQNAKIFPDDATPDLIQLVHGALLSPLIVHRIRIPHILIVISFVVL